MHRAVAGVGGRIGRGVKLLPPKTIKTSARFKSTYFISAHVSSLLGGKRCTDRLTSRAIQTVMERIALNEHDVFH